MLTDAIMRVDDGTNRRAHAARSRHANRPELRTQAGVPFHRVGHGSVGGCGKLLHSERRFHVQLVRQRSCEFGPSLTADALGHHTCDKVAVEYWKVVRMSSLGSR